MDIPMDMWRFVNKIAGVVCEWDDLMEGVRDTVEDHDVLEADGVDDAILYTSIRMAVAGGLSMLSPYEVKHLEADAGVFGISLLDYLVQLVWETKEVQRYA